MRRKTVNFHLTIWFTDFEDKDKIDLNNSANILAKIVNRNTNYFDLNELEKEKTYYYVVTSMDRLHNESESVILEVKN